MIRFLQVTIWLHSLKSESFPKNLFLCFFFSQPFSHDSGETNLMGLILAVSPILLRYSTYLFFFIFDKHCFFLAKWTFRYWCFLFLLEHHYFSPLHGACGQNTSNSNSAWSKWTSSPGWSPSSFRWSDRSRTPSRSWTSRSWSLYQPLSREDWNFWWVINSSFPLRKPFYVTFSIGFLL